MGRRLAVLAGAGALVSEVVGAALNAGDTVGVFALVPQPPRAGADLIAVDPGDPKGLLAALLAYGATHMVMAGGISLSDRQREQVARLADSSASLGDASFSGLLRGYLAGSGATLLGVHEVATDLLAGTGLIAGPPVGAATMAVARFALAAAREVGRLDLGQAAVVTGTRVIAAEDVAGTDELLRRVGRYRAEGRIGDGTSVMVLGKALKPQQPMFVDLPAIGADTVENAAASGVIAIAVEADRTLLIDRPALIMAAERHGVSVLGLTIDG